MKPARLTNNEHLEEYKKLKEGDLKMKYRNSLIGGLLIVMLVLFVGCEETSKKHYADENWSDANLVRGGLLYDKWWKVNGSAEPTTDFPLYASGEGTKSGSDTWKCKECHGWDYIGDEGHYATGSHYTGFEGVWTARLNDHADIFDAIKDEGGDHDFSSVLSDDDVLDLTKFIADGLVDMGDYIDANGVVTGDTTNGATLFAANCEACHGADGQTLPIEEDEAGVVGVGWLADDNPWEMLHKIRWGQPGTSMPSMKDVGLTDDECADILAYAQNSLPGM